MAAGLVFWGLAQNATGGGVLSASRMVPLTTRAASSLASKVKLRAIRGAAELLRSTTVAVVLDAL